MENTIKFKPTMNSPPRRRISIAAISDLNQRKRQISLAYHVSPCHNYQSLQERNSSNWIVKPTHKTALAITKNIISRRRQQRQRDLLQQSPAMYAYMRYVKTTNLPHRR